MKPRIFLILSALTLSAAAEPVALFNGETLTNWDGNPEVWRVEDGVIAGGSMEGNPRNEFLTTRQPAEDFVLKFEYKLTGTEGFVNGGVQFRSLRMTEPAHEMIGYQADIGAGHTGALYDESRRKKFLARPEDKLIERIEKPGEWNRYEIRCEGDRVRLYVNGELTVDYTEEEMDELRHDGLIGLQIHGDCKAVIRFRNIMFEEIEAPAEAP